MSKKSIDLHYLKENSFDDQDFIRDILITTRIDFEDLKNQLAIQGQEENFDSETVYALLHKFKPSVSMFKMDTYELYKKYGTSNQSISFKTYQEIKDKLIDNLSVAVVDIENELNKITD